MTAPRTSGFTLIELSIVLVIIGLIVGGVMTGRDLIFAAAMRKQITQFEKWTSAINTFKLSYNCLPGDCAKATQFGLSANGNGDGAIGDGFFPGISGEPQLAFVHLAAAKLIEGNFSNADCLPGTGFPTSPISESIGFTIFSAIHSGQSNNNGSYSFVDGGGIWFRSGYSNSPYCNNFSGAGVVGLPSGGLTPLQLHNFDDKIDDGLPFTGKLRLMGQDGVSEPLDIMCNESTLGIYGRNCSWGPTLGPTQCANNTVGSNIYMNSNSMPSCPFSVRAM